MSFTLTSESWPRPYNIISSRTNHLKLRWALLGGHVCEVDHHSMNHAAAVFVEAEALKDQVGDAAELFRSGASDINEVVACGVDSKHVWERQFAKVALECLPHE